MQTFMNFTARTLCRARRWLAASMSVLFLLGSAGCAGSGATMTELLPCAGPAPVLLTIGQECAVRLPANPSTGYEWVLQPIVPAVVQPVGAGDYVAAAAVPQRVGQGGEMVFRLRAVARGNATLQWDYRRAWEPLQTPPVKVHTLTVQVR